MVQSELKESRDHIDTASAAGGPINGFPDPKDDVTGLTPHNDASSQSARATHADPPACFNEALQDAELLLTYAAKEGIDIDPCIRINVLRARAASGAGWNEETAANLLEALTKLAAKLRTTAEKLRGSKVGTYWKVAIGLAIIIVPFSLGSFLTSAISDAIRKDIVTANELAVKLTAQLPPAKIQAAVPTPGQHDIPIGLSEVDVITELQQYASTIRSIYGRARQLNLFFVFHLERDPSAGMTKDEFREKLQLPVPLRNLANAANDKTFFYQERAIFRAKSPRRHFVYLRRDDHLRSPSSLCPVGYLRLSFAFVRIRSKHPDVYPSRGL